MVAAVIRIGPALLTDIKRAAEAAYPDECCGLLVGRGKGPDGCQVDRVVATANVIEGDRRRGFEIDPQVQFDLLRSLRGKAGRIVGHYHSHPDHPPFPSERDLQMAFEPELFWIIVSVNGGQAGEARGHRIDKATGRFREVALTTES
jgi:proteasome lid subunit RPN8/RPN11